MYLIFSTLEEFKGCTGFQHNIFLCHFNNILEHRNTSEEQRCHFWMLGKAMEDQGQKWQQRDISPPPVKVCLSFFTCFYLLFLSFEF